MNLQTLKVGLVSLLVFAHAGFVSAKNNIKASTVSETSAESAGGLLVLSLMGSAVSLSGWEGQGGLLNSSKSTPQPAHAKITRVRERADGSSEIELKGPAATGTEGEVRATVILPNQANTAQPKVAIGDTLTLAPSHGGAGWVVHQSDGVALGFLPTQQTMHDEASERF